jgi:hypothetical protein
LNFKQLALALMIFSVFSRQAFARNDDLKTLINNVKDGVILCGYLDKADVISTLNKCGLKSGANDDLIKLGLNGLGAFENVIFSEALKLQKAKNKCLVDQLEQVAQVSEKRDLFIAQSSIVWLRYKKASLILERCDLLQARLAQLPENSWGSAPKNQNELLNWAEKKKSNQRKYLHENLNYPLDWANYCLEEKNIKNLKVLQQQSALAMPVLPDKKLLEIIESERNSLVHEKTGKPLSDLDILTEDIESLPVELRSSKELLAKLNQYFSKIHDQRSQMNKILDAENGNQSSKASEDLRDHLYEDGTLNEVLLSYGLSSSDDPATRKLVRCLMHRYERSMGTDIAGVLLATLLFRGSYGKLISPRSAAYFGAIDQFGPDVIKSCMQLIDKKSAAAQTKLKSVATVNSEVNKKLLPQGLSYGIYTIADDIESCQQLNQQRSSVNSDYARLCLYDAAMVVAPIKIGMALMATKEPALQLIDHVTGPKEKMKGK